MAVIFQKRTVIFQKRTVTFITDRTFTGVSFIIITATERELL